MSATEKRLHDALKPFAAAAALFEDNPPTDTVVRLEGQNLTVGDLLRARDALSAAPKLPMSFGIPLFEDMRRALEHVEAVYRLNFVAEGESSSTLENLQRVIARISLEEPAEPALPQAVIDWALAEKKRVDAVAAYNERVKYLNREAREHGTPFPPGLSRYSALIEHERAVSDLASKMLAAVLPLIEQPTTEGSMT